MYKICSQFLIVLSCVMLMVVSLQVDYVMIACILTGIIVCTFIDMQDLPQMSPASHQLPFSGMILGCLLFFLIGFDVFTLPR